MPQGQGVGAGPRAGFEYLSEKEALCRIRVLVMSVLARLRRIRGAVPGRQVAYVGKQNRRLR